MAYFTTDTSLNMTYLGHQFSGTGPHWIDDALLNELYAELTAAGVTVVRWNCLEVPVPANATVFDLPFWKPRVQVVIDAVYLVPHTNLVGADTNYCIFTLETYNSGGTLSGTVTSATMNAAKGTFTAFTRNSFGTIASATVAADSTLNLERATIGTGLANTASLLVVHYHTA